MSKTHIYYLPTCLIDNPPKPPTITLIVRLFRKHKTKSGNWVTNIKSDAFSYNSEDEMAKDIEIKGMRELPQEAEINLRYVPPRHRSHNRLSQLTNNKEGIEK